MGLQVMVGSICCKLDTLVYIMGLVLTVLYLLSGVAAIVWFVLTHTEVSIFSYISIFFKYWWLVPLFLFIFYSTDWYCRNSFFTYTILLGGLHGGVDVKCMVWRLACYGSALT
jgi:hypothetical protein